MQFGEKLQPQKMGFREYIEALEDERRKIQVFHRELPLSLELVTQAIEACRQQLSETTTEDNLNGQSECSEQTSTEEGPVFEEFIPIKKRVSPECDEDDGDNDNDDDDDDDDEPHSHRHKISKGNNNNYNKSSTDDKTKSDWLSLRSVQLWNPDPLPAKEDVPRKASILEVKRNGGAFQPFHRDESTFGKANASSPAAGKAPSSPPVPATSSTGPAARNNAAGSSSKREEKGQSQRKQRRCWSQELHKRFLHALQQLGGADSATPKQIRELMKVDGLTNDEVKSHLQKFRLHTRRPSPMISNNANSQSAPLFLVGNIFVQPPEYATVATSTASPNNNNGIYAPVASHPKVVTPHTSQAHHSSIKNPPQFKQLEVSEHSHSEERANNHSEGAVHSNSPASSSSTHTTTTSPGC